MAEPVKKPKAETPDPKLADLAAEIERLKAIMRRNGWSVPEKE